MKSSHKKLLGIVKAGLERAGSNVDLAGRIAAGNYSGGPIGQLAAHPREDAVSIDAAGLFWHHAGTWCEIGPFVDIVECSRDRDRMWRNAGF
jgi:hypothetical protein